MSDTTSTDDEPTTWAESREQADIHGKKRPLAPQERRQAERRHGPQFGRNGDEEADSDDLASVDTKHGGDL
ncbi:hypothetical protein [Halobacterium jilantaiense]|uniref:Uncharacterized protein n=1 Tax=Halobacterium jilantaiense TaxID=355548 RepID=A0A1I0P7Y0_9EURY|nr:hypothetical protein [Halobacterium jilantaiense]SEW10142.1 hypothetical protein SAMN04487945_1453 [Halobacterium jilantaiense]